MGKASDWRFELIKLIGGDPRLIWRDLLWLGRVKAALAALRWICQGSGPEPNPGEYFNGDLEGPPLGSRA